MDNEQLVRLVELAPIDKKARIHTLGEFIKGRQKDIKDPYFVRILNRIEIFDDCHSK